MAVDDVIVRAGPVAVPLDYKVPNGTEIIPRSISARLNGSGAGGAFVPVLEVIAPSGAVTAYCARRVEIAAGASVLVSWFPGIAEADDASSSPSGGGTVESVSSPQGTLTVNNPTGPAVNVDMPATGVGAGSYGDSSHSAQVTLDAEGRVTAAASVPIAGGSGTIGFEINYTQKTSATFITATTIGTAQTILAPGAITFDGAPVLVTFYSPDTAAPNVAGAAIHVYLFEGATPIARLTYLQSVTGTQSIESQIGMYRFTPTAGSHTYTVAAFVSVNSGAPFVDGGAGGSGNPSPCFVRFAKV